MFPCAWQQLIVFALSSDWLNGLSAFEVVGQNNHFDFGLMTLN